MWVRTAAKVSPVPLQFTVPTEPSCFCISSFLHWAETLSGFSACGVEKRSGHRPREDAKVSVDSAENAHLLMGLPAMCNRRNMSSSKLKF